MLISANKVGWQRRNTSMYSKIVMVIHDSRVNNLIILFRKHTVAMDKIALQHYLSHLRAALTDCVKILH